MPRNSNPCLKVPKYPDKKKERFLTNDELQRLEDILIARTIDSKSSPYTLASLWMLLYTGCRESEVLTLKWKDVHLDDGYLYLEDSKVGVRTIPLNEKAKVVIRSLEKKESNPYVFCGGIPGQHLKETKTTWRKVRKLAGISDVRLHDLRHSFASFALKKGVDLYTVSKLLGHKNIKTTTRYAHLELDHLKKATNIVAEVFK
jgi:integrase